MRSIHSRYGKCWYYGKDEYIGRSIHNYGEFSGEECEKIIELSSGQCLDIGANIGFMSMALLHAGRRVVAFEPQPELFKLLELNCPNAICMNFALSNIRGVGRMPRIRYGSKGNYGGLGLGLKSELGTIDVNMCTLDELGRSPGFIKLDVEGHELAVLKGGKDTILKYKPVLYIEDDRVENSIALRKYISNELGYSTIQEHNPPMFRKNNFFDKQDNIWGINYESRNIICLP
jgi:FkbM family methyltransferase